MWSSVNNTRLKAFSKALFRLHSDVPKHFREGHRKSYPEIYLNDPIFNKNQKFCNNLVYTTKYDLLNQNFAKDLKTLYVEFKKKTTSYFLITTILACIPSLSPVRPLSNFMGVLFIIVVSLLREAYEDYKRFINDEKNNSSVFEILDPTTAEKKKVSSSQICVGDIIYLSENERVPADLVVLLSSSDNGICYIQTSSLDGEIDLKTVQAIPKTQRLNIESICSLKGTIACDLPNHLTNVFSATISIENSIQLKFDQASVESTLGANNLNTVELLEGSDKFTEKIPINDKNFLMAGSVLKNTNWLLGICVYAGYETKMCLNARRPRQKTSALTKAINNAVMGIFGFMLLIAVTMSTLYDVFSSLKNFKVQYLSLDSNRLLIFFKSLVSYILVLSYFVPVSLIVTIEFSKFAQAIFMQWDLDMMYNGRGCTVNTSSLTDDLSRVKCIFSDKTGTLTENLMKFEACALKDRIFYNTDDDQNTCGLMYVLKQNNRKSEMVKDFLKHMALCHTITSTLVKSDSEERVSFKSLMEMFERGEQFCLSDYKINYITSSPDEEALCLGAMNNGVIFASTVNSHMFVSVFGRLEVWEILLQVEFTSARSRMCVVLRSLVTQRILLLCKGADHVIFSRLRSDISSEEIENLVQSIQCFNYKGYRSLVFAFRELEEAEWKEFYERWHTTSLQLDVKKNIANELVEELEKDLVLVGSTAVEDRLQDGVVDTIEKIRQANISIWMLTGDKQEVAINIGYSTSIIPPETEVINLNISDKLQLRKVLLNHLLYDCKMTSLQRKILEVNLREDYHDYDNEDSSIQFFQELNLKPLKKDKRIRKVKDFSLIKKNIEMENPNFLNKKHNQKFSLSDIVHKKQFSLAVDGKYLESIFCNFCELFLLLSSHACSVVCSRITPIQKSMIVKLVSKGAGIFSMAIGDGENDVSMILEAQIGVGIYGVEKSQASRVSDYSISRFKDLQRLIFVHGHYNTLRNKVLTYYIFYKNFMLNFPLIVYGVYSGFSSQLLYSDYMMALNNIFFTSLPIFIYSLFEKDVDESEALEGSVVQAQVNYLTLSIWILLGIVQGLIVFYSNYFVWRYCCFENGKSMQIYELGHSIMTSVFIVINIKLMIQSRCWNILNALSYLVSFLAYFNSLFIISNYSGIKEYYYMFNNIFSSSMFYFSLLLSVLSAMLFDVLIKSIDKYVFNLYV